MKYSVSMMATKVTRSRYSASHAAATVEGVSEDEVYGKAMRMCEKCFPQRNGWEQHSISLFPSDEVTDIKAITERP